MALGEQLPPPPRNSAPTGAFLDEVNVAALALMGEVTRELDRAAVDWFTAALALVSLLLVRHRLNPAWLIRTAARFGLAFAGCRP